ncbi:hypothetical protein QFZ73_000316 [Peribacillus sp. V2I11]|nr:hypothetical protein [Peribacillus sp. V2I11]
MFYNQGNKFMWVSTMIQTSMVFSPYMAIYDVVVPKDNMLRKINELIDFSFLLEELRDNSGKYRTGYIPGE